MTHAGPGPSSRRERRYFNVFFAYRGQAVSDVDLTPESQLEDNVTRALAITLDHASPETLQAFLVEVCSMPAASRAPALLTQQPVAQRDSAPVARVVGISPRGTLDDEYFTDTAEGSRPDLLIEQTGEALVLVESKVVLGTDGRQMNRHARAFGLDEADFTKSPPTIPDSWIQRTWEEVGNWAESVRDPDPVAAFLLGEFAEYLELAGLRGALPPVRARLPVAGLRPAEQRLLEELRTNADLVDVERACRSLYGHPGLPHYVHGDDEEGPTGAVADSRAVAAAYREAREPVPPQLLKSVRGVRGNVITARRALCIAYGPKSRFLKSVATPQIRDSAAALLGVGADRAVLLGLLAAAEGRSGPIAERLTAVVLQAWSRAKPVGHAAPELHAALGVSAARALSISGAP